jgi:hypothetical protein
MKEENIIFRNPVFQVLKGSSIIKICKLLPKIYSSRLFVLKWGKIWQCLLQGQKALNYYEISGNNIFVTFFLRTSHRLIKTRLQDVNLMNEDTFSAKVYSTET